MSVEPQSRARRKLVAAARLAGRRLSPSLPPALFLTDPARTPDPLTVVCHLPAGFGVVYRHFGAGDRETVARALAAACRRRHLTLLIAGDPALAARAGADGVHWPFRLRQASRKWQGRFAIQTVSAHSARELRAALGFPVDAVVVSTVFASGSATAGAPIGAFRFAGLASSSGISIFGLGGVHAGNAGRIARSGGFAAVEGMRPFASGSGR